MIDQKLKKSLGQMMHAVQVVGAAGSDGSDPHLYCSHWVMQVSFEEPIVMASVSPKHDTYAHIASTGLFSVSVLAGDQIAEGQYFSYPGHRFHNVATEYVEDWDGLPVVVNSIAYLRCEVQQRLQLDDHELFFARVVATRENRLKDPPLLYSSRLGWRVAGGPAREPGVSIRDQLLARLGEDVSQTGEPDLSDDPGRTAHPKKTVGSRPLESVGLTENLRPTEPVVSEP
jgi:flavin reductase (DIM6/NTAB) family NADH-FMN oxidoreductase RutF